MKSVNKIFIAFLLNLIFSVFELFGGIITGSIAILSDALHDFGDAASIGISLFLERKSNLPPDEKYTYGYRRFSVLGAVITNSILIFGSAIVIYNAILRILNPVKINHSGMIIFAIIGVLVNLAATIITREPNSLNQKAVNLHMLEDVLGWLAVLVGGILIKFTSLTVIDPILSLLVAIFILIHAVKNLFESLNLFLEKAPAHIHLHEIEHEILKIDDVKGIHHIHIWSIDEHLNYITMHVVCNNYSKELKDEIKHKLTHLGISHSTLEFETESEECKEFTCNTKMQAHSCSHHHKHHH